MQAICGRRRTIFAVALVALSIAATAAVPHIVDAVKYPDSNSHASPEMKAAFPTLF